MADSSDVLLQHWNEQTEQSRQCEDQRATLTNMILLVGSAALGFIAQRGLDRYMLLVTVPLVVVGLLGAVAFQRNSMRDLGCTTDRLEGSRISSPCFSRT